MHALLCDEGNRIQRFSREALSLLFINRKVAHHHLSNKSKLGRGLPRRTPDSDHTSEYGAAKCHT